MGHMMWALVWERIGPPQAPQMGVVMGAGRSVGCGVGDMTTGGVMAALGDGMATGVGVTPTTVAGAA